VAETILEVKHLKTYFYPSGAEGPEMRAVDDLSYEVHRGECVAIIGESGSGKSVEALSILRLIPCPPGLIVGGEVLFHGQDLLKLSDAEMRKIRGSKISMIFQEPSTALNPVVPVGKQICETLRVHRGMKKREAMKEAVRLLERVNIPNAAERAKQYPFEFSGGMQQRAMIAMAMACNPDVLIADEPTTALDVTVQAQVLEELNKMRKDTDTALIIITHNLGVVARYADSVKIVYGGKIVEEGNPHDVFEDPRHPYTLGLIRAVPRLDMPKSSGLSAIDGEPPDMSKIPPNCCAFHSRCKYATEECRTQRPELSIPDAANPGHRCACFHTDDTQAEREALLEINRKSLALSEEEGAQ
jgi:oligopeptide/dipeptide ABC transporter ATP-binding protein